MFLKIFCCKQMDNKKQNNIVMSTTTRVRSVSKSNTPILNLVASKFKLAQEKVLQSHHWNY